MAASRFLALLRGINVGGNNVIPMRELQECFESMGLADVTTYIQSGNVLFAAEGDTAALEQKIEQGLAKRFSYSATVVVLTAKALRRVVTEAPPGFGQDTAAERYDVLFVKSPLTTAEALEKIPRKEGVDHASAGTHALYFSRLISKATQSKLSRITAMPLYQLLTIRNWNTTTKLLALMTEASNER